MAEKPGEETWKQNICKIAKTQLSAFLLFFAVAAEKIGDSLVIKSERVIMKSRKKDIDKNHSLREYFLANFLFTNCL